MLTFNRMISLKNILVFVLLSAGFSFGQSTTLEPRHSLQAQLTLPNTVSNRPFNDIMQGLVNVHLGYQFTTKNSLCFGGGIKSTYLDINEFKTPDKLQGGLLMVGPYTKLGYQKFYGNFGVDVGVKIGYSLNFSANDNCKEILGRSYNFDAGFVEPEIGLALQASENSSFRLAISHAVYGFQFKPHMFCQPEFSGYTDVNLDKAAQIFSIGFGYSYYFGNKKS